VSGIIWPTQDEMWVSATNDQMYYARLVDQVDRSVDLIRNVSDQNRFDVEYLEHDLIPALGLNNETLSEQPPELSQYFGTGLHLWQYPNQLAKYLVWLAKNATGIRTFLEIGCRWGGTFILVNEWLKRIGAPIESSVAIDPIPATPFVTRYMEISSTPIYYKECFSTNPEFATFCDGYRPDMVFIDGDHRMAGVMNDHLLFRSSAKIIVHHDISSDSCPDTSLFWKYVSHAEDCFTARAFTDQYPSVRGSFLGIGALLRTEPT